MKIKQKQNEKKAKATTGLFSCCVALLLLQEELLLQSFAVEKLFFLFQVIQGLISVDEDGEQNTFPAHDEISKLVLMAHSLAAFCGSLEKHVSQKLSARFTADTTRWLSQLFGWVSKSLLIY